MTGWKDLKKKINEIDTKLFFSQRFDYWWYDVVIYSYSSNIQGVFWSSIRYLCKLVIGDINISKKKILWTYYETVKEVYVLSFKKLKMDSIEWRSFMRFSKFRNTL